MVPQVVHAAVSAASTELSGSKKDNNEEILPSATADDNVNNHDGNSPNI